MTTKEKAKAYDEALERAKEYLTPNNPECIDTLDAITTIFPELKESDDERISREITEFILTHRIDEPNDIEDTNPWLAWLEKQGEKKEINPTLQEKDRIDDAFTKMMLKPQIVREEKPKWSEEDEIGSDATIELLEYFINYAPEFRRPAIRRSIDWLKSLKKRNNNDVQNIHKTRVSAMV